MRVHLRLNSAVGVVMVAAIGLGAQLSPVPGVQAQEGDQCEQLASDALARAKAACAGLAPGEICYGYAGVTATTASGGTALATSGDKATVADITSLVASAAASDSGDWGLAVAMLPAGLPEDSGQAVTAVLYGDAQIARPAQVAPDQATLVVSNRGGSPINLRNGAGVTYDVVGQLAPGEQATADGRNEQSDWVRIQFQGGEAWVFTPLIGWEGDQNALNALKVLLPNDVTPAFQAGEPFQAFTLTTGESACNAAPSGLLLQYAGEQPASLQVNQVSLEFSYATLLLTAAPNDALEVKTLAGSGTVTARGIPEQVSTGGAVRVTLGGEDRLTPSAAPTVLRSYPFPDVAYAPLGLLPGSITCIAGLPASGANAFLRVGPGAQRGELGRMNADATYAVIGWANDPEGAAWWQLDTGATPSWVAQSDVRAIGACEAVAQVEPPPLVFAAPSFSSTGGEGTVSVEGGSDLVPAGNSVWQMHPGTDHMTGPCSGAPAINFCDHLAAVSPVSGGIMWKGMEASPYPMTRIQPNVYAYSGPNVQGTGTISMTLTFTSETTVNMTMSLKLNSEPNCEHIYYYTGTRNW
jgi:uncharacterized protein YgiM (DUF1202 family)